MANQFSLNWPIDTNTSQNVFSAVWRLTRVMKAAGWTVKAHSDGTTKTAAGTNNNDSWGSNANPLNDTYPTAFDSAAPWIVMQGPQTLKLPLSGNYTGTFVRGEGVTQVTSGATGELLGIVWDSGTSSGWAIIMPRTGTWDGTHGVSGNTSGASFTPSSLKTFTREVVFAKQSATVTNGTLLYICADASAESAQLYSTLASASGCTATVFPGGGGTSNGFPALGLCLRGTGGSVSHAEWFLSTAGYSSLANAVATNATPGAGVTADGTFWVLMGRTSPAGAQSFFGFFRLDDCEPGDVDPFIWGFICGNVGVASYTRTVSNSFFSNAHFHWTDYFQVSFPCWKGYIARDCPQTARDITSYFFAAYRNTSNNTFVPVMNVGQPNTMRLANHPSASPPLVRDFISVTTDAAYTGSPGIRMHKGTIRWMMVTSNGSYKDTFDSQQWIVIHPFTTSQTPGVVIGPWDGSTLPS